MDPDFDGVIGLCPRNIGGVGGGVVDVRQEAKFPSHHFEEALPLGVVRGLEVEDDRDMRGNKDSCVWVEEDCGGS